MDSRPLKNRFHSNCDGLTGWNTRTLVPAESLAKKGADTFVGEMDREMNFPVRKSRDRINGKRDFSKGTSDTNTASLLKFSLPGPLAGNVKKTLPLDRHQA